ncbi:hypothetical protein NUACC21_74760 [Scytonema sp. NUACC21]
MIRKLLFGACIGGLIMGSFYEAPQEQLAQEQRLWQNIQSSNEKTRSRAEGELLRIAGNKDGRNRAEAEAIYKQILAINPNSATAHTRLAEIQLKRWSRTKNLTDKESGLQHLRKAIEFARQNYNSVSENTPLLKEGASYYVKQLEKVESQVNRGTPSHTWNFPKY